jgi:hypothetical protein
VKYILSQKEYDDLLERAVKVEAENTRELQEFCTMVADTLPIKWTWGEGKDTPTPWGCILTEVDVEWYCDQCPAQKVCPHQYKEWSK